MKRHFLTHLFNPFVPIIGYFNTKKFTLKHITFLAVLIISSLSTTAQNYSNIEFIENKGQWDPRVQYMGDVNNGAFFVRSGGVTVLQYNPVDYANFKEKLHGHKAGGDEQQKNIPGNQVLRAHAYEVDFIGASLQTKVVGDKPLATYNNYFIGNNPAKWASGCKTFQAITMENIYPNIDARYYTDNGVLKYDIIVKPGGDVSKIALKYKGVDKLQVKNKELTIATSLGEFKEGAPFTYQFGAKGRTEVSCRYSVKGDEVRFDIKNYDPSSTLIIDPSIVFCSFAGSRSDNWGFTATYGPDGSLFGGGIVYGNQFPTSPGAYQVAFQNGNWDIGIIKLTPDGSGRVYATYLGGSGLEQPHSLICDNQGNLVMAGRSNSGNYPVSNASLGGAGYDIVVTKLNATGTNIIGSRKIGGTADDGVNISAATRALNSLQQNYGDDGRSEVNLDAAGNIYVASATQSTNFPVTAGVFQTTNRGQQDGILLKFPPNLATLSFASYLGGNGDDAAYVVSIHNNGDIYVGGGTRSTNLLGNTAGTIGPLFNGNIDGFVSIISNNGATINRTTYLGTTGIDQVFGVQFDNSGFPYVMGQTTGTWPVINATYSNPGSKQFIAKLQPDLSAYIYSTVFGSGASIPNISPVAFLVDRCENVYISGWGGAGFGTGFTSAGTGGMPVTPDAFKSTTDGKDFYFFVLRKNATGQLFGSFFGENNATNSGNDHVDGGTSRFDRNGVIYQAMCANCEISGLPRPTFPTTPGSWSPFNPATTGSKCNLGMVKIAMNLAGVAAGVQSAISGAPRDTAGCLPLTVDFIDTVANGVSYEWHFNYVPGNGPDLTTTTPAASFTYTAVGTYRVMLVAIDPATCNVRDSSFLNIRVGDLQANLAMRETKLPPCNSFTYQFENLSTTDISRPFTDTSFIWDFGDNSPRVVSGLAPIQHTFPGPGTYFVKLILKDTAYCNNPDSIELELSVAENVDARFTTPAVGCVPYTVVLDNTSLAGQTWLWDFGDGPPATTSTSFEPTHTYTTPGTYTITLVAYNPNTCNLTDTARFTIQVFAKPAALFDFTPLTPLANTPVTFNNLSSPDAVRFKWNFGDGDSLLTTSRAPVQHQYNATGTFTACLTAYNAVDCDSVFCRPVQAVIIPVVDVPNAFTPLTNDLNSIVSVRGFGIAKMQFIIWNRWGQKVFETNNRFQGWDGKVKGVVQPMDVYAYTLSVEFFDGVKTTKKGDITLIR